MNIIDNLLAQLAQLRTNWQKSRPLADLVDSPPGVDQVIEQTLQQARKIANAFKGSHSSREDRDCEGQPSIAILPKGLIIYGQGCGCGGLARAIAKEIDLHFIAGTTCEAFGRACGKESVAHYFSQAKELAHVTASRRPVMLYLSGANFLTSVAAEMQSDAQASTAEIAKQMQNLTANSNVLVVIEADSLRQIDPVLLTDGCFDVQIEVEKPDYKGRLSIFCQHLESARDLARPSAASRAPILVSLDGAWEEERAAELDQICQECAVLANGLCADQIYRALFQLRAQVAIAGSVTAEQLYQAIEHQRKKP